MAVYGGLYKEFALQLQVVSYIMDRIYIIIGLFVIGCIGFLKIIYEIYCLNSRIDFLYNYQNNFVGFSNQILEKNFFDNKKYNFCLENSNIIQNEINSSLSLSFYDNLTGIHKTNYDIIPNNLMLMQEMYMLKIEDTFSANRFQSLVSEIDNVIVVHTGILKSKLEVLKSSLINPIKLFCNGIKFFVEIPEVLFLWCGLITESNVARFDRSWLKKIIVGISSLIALVGGIISIVTGWDKFAGIIQSLFYQ